jgi:hypothetical protein
MLASPAVNPARVSLPSRRDPCSKLFIAATILFLAVVIAEALFIAIAAPSWTEIGTLYVI